MQEAHIYRGKEEAREESTGSVDGLYSSVPHKRKSNINSGVVYRHDTSARLSVPLHPNADLYPDCETLWSYTDHGHPSANGFSSGRKGVEGAGFRY